MSDPGPPDQPLSPEAQAIFNRARRVFALSMGLLLVGFMVIGAVLVYRATRDGGPATRYGAEQLVIPAGSTVLGTQLADGAIAVTYTTGGAGYIRLFDGRSGALLREIPLAQDP